MKLSVGRLVQKRGSKAVKGMASFRNEKGGVRSDEGEEEVSRGGTKTRQCIWLEKKK